MVVGSIELLPVPDAIGLLADGDLYPEVPAEAWQPYHALFLAGAIPLAAGLVAVGMARRLLAEQVVSGVPA